MKKHIKTSLNEWLESEVNISDIIKSLINEYDIEPDAINQGECMLFAEELYNILKSKGIKSELLSDGLFYDPFNDDTPELMLNPNDYGKKPENFDKIGLPSHYWIYYKGKHYDAETPEGVDDMFKLPTIKKFYIEHQ